MFASLRSSAKEARAIVKSGVRPSESGDAPAGLDMVAHIDPVLELHSLDDLGQENEASDLPPTFLSTHPQLADHHQHQARGCWVATNGNVTDKVWKEYIKNQQPPEPYDNFTIV